MVSGGLGNVITHVSLHSGDPGTTGTNELTGGGYARQAVTWTSAASGERTNSAQLSFSVPAGTVLSAGFWDAVTVGNFYGWAPLGTLVSGVATIPQSTDVFTNYAHGLSNTQQVYLFGVSGGSLPTGFSTGTAYFVVGATTDTFQLSTTSGGSAVNATADGEVIFQKVVPEVFGSAGTLNIAANGLHLSAAFV